MSTYLARVGDREVDVAVEGDGDSLQVSVGGRRRRVDLAEVAPGWFSLIVDGVSHDLGIMPDAADASQAGRIAPGFRHSRIVLDGRLSGVEILRGGRRIGSRARGAGAARGHEVRAPMPGLLVAVRVTEGAAVAPGQPLVVMEAMKMQMEIRSPGEGTVRRVHVEAGVEIAGGQVLLTID